MQIISNKFWKTISKLWNQAPPRWICSPQNSFCEQLSNYSSNWAIEQKLFSRCKNCDDCVVAHSHTCRWLFWWIARNLWAFPNFPFRDAKRFHFHSLKILGIAVQKNRYRCIYRSIQGNHISQKQQKIPHNSWSIQWRKLKWLWAEIRMVQANDSVRGWGGGAISERNGLLLDTTQQCREATWSKKVIKWCRGTSPIIGGEAV